MGFQLPFNPGKKFTQIGVGIVLLILVSALAIKECHGADNYMQFGAGSTVVRGAAATIGVNAVLPDKIGDTDIEVGATLLGESSFREQRQRNNFAIHAGIVDGFGRFDVGLGVAYLQNVDEYNGSNLNFQLLLGYRFKRFPITLRLQHFSNAGTQMPNRGRDMLMAYYRF